MGGYSGGSPKNIGPVAMDEEDLLNMEIPPPPAQITSVNGTDERLIISHIEVENFKSYYGKQTIGPFHKNFTAIIGPNGSGKSNVIDSLLFVFGYRASKIRSKKVSVLIHSSAGRDNIDSCTVAVFFKKIIDTGRNEMHVVEGSEFYVSRTAHRDNSSRYTLNGKTTQFKDIGKVLLSCGIDLIHNRFLILQGEVEQISLMNPKAQNENEEGMLEYLEDIIGSSRLKLPINKLLSKLSKLNEARSSQLVRMRHSEKEKVALEGPAKTVITKLKIENAISLVRSKILSLKKLTISDEIAELTPEHVRLLTELDAAQKEVNELVSHAKQIKNGQKGLQRVLEKKQEALAKSTSIISERKQMAAKVENDRERLTTQQKKLASDITKELAKISDLEGVPEKAQKSLIKLKSELEETEEVIKVNSAEVEARLPIVKEKTESLRGAHQKIDAELGKHIVVEDELAGNLALAQEELNNLQRDETMEQRILADLRDRLAIMEDDFVTKSKNLKTSGDSVPDLEKTISSLISEQKMLSNEESVLDEKVRSLLTEVEHCRQSAEQVHGTNRLLRALMEQKQSGKIKGLFGRLGDLGAIDEKYDVAISTTCGALDNIVVDCVETAQLCIKFLQRENLGVASFIALDKQQHLLSRMNNKPNTPENVPRLFDLIRVTDKKVLPAFYYALSDTLIADDITSATRIAMSGSQRWRTVTLQGEVVEVSGAMTGGGNAQKRGKIGQKVKINTSQDDPGKNLKKLCNELEVAETKLAEIRQSLTKAQKNYRDRQTDLTRAQNFAKNLKADIEMLTKNIGELKLQITEQTKKVEEVAVNPEVLQKCAEKIEKYKKESDKLSKLTDGLRMKLIDLTEKIDSVNDEIVGEYQKALREAEEKKKSLEKSISKENNAITSNERNLKKAKAHVTDLENDLAQSESRSKELGATALEIKTDIERLAEEVEIKKTEVTEAEIAYNESAEQTKQLNSNELSINKRVDELRNEKERISAHISQCSSSLNTIVTQINKLKVSCLDSLPSNLLENEKDDDLLKECLCPSGDASCESNNDATMHSDDEMEPMECSSTVEDGINEVEAADKISKKKILKTAPVPNYSLDTVRLFDKKNLEEQLKKLEERIDSQKNNNFNLGLLMDYMKQVAVFEAEAKVFLDISKQRDLHREFCERLKKQRLQEFMEGFQVIGERLKEMYQMITLGGDASLDLVDSLDPFSEGVSFSVRPPKKSWKRMANLSGGEKTLASLALVFSLHHYRPTPFYVMDEIDAALDYRNVSILSYLIKDKTTNTQFIIISLRNNMFEKCDRIVGIYKINDCTRHIVFDNEAQ